MAYKIIFQERAERDIADAFTYIYERAPEPAVDWYREIRSAIESLSEMPGRCSQAPEARKLGLELRQLIFGKRPGKYRIIFRIVKHENEVHVLAVRHGARKPIELDELQGAPENQDILNKPDEDEGVRSV